MINNTGQDPIQKMAILVMVAVLPLLSGVAALSHELLWSRRLIDLLGATDWVTGRVLGLFFFGISMGGYFATYLNTKKYFAIRQLAMVELSVALFALPAAFLPGWTDWIWQAVGTETLLSWKGAALKMMIAGVVILPPAIAMGFTLPFFVRAATDLGGDVASVGIWAYSFNTLGGVLGLWLTSSYMLGTFGAQQTMFAIIGINLLIALVSFAVFFAAKNRGDGHDSEPDQSVHDEMLNQGKSVSRTQLLVLSFVSGLVVLAIEVLILRLVALVVPTSFHTTSALLANVILILAVSSILISLQNNLFGIQEWVLVVGLAGCAACLCFCPAILYQQTDQLISLRYLQGLNGLTIDSINEYWLLVFWLVASVGGAALLFSGLVFPTLLSMSSPSDPSGRMLGGLLAANGIGGLLGSELTNSLLLNYVGVYQSFLVLAFIVSLIVFGILLKISWQLGVGATAVLGFVIFVGYQSINEIPYVSPRSKTKYKIKETTFGYEGVFLIVEDEAESKSILMNNQYVLGSTGVADDERRQLRLPWLLHGSASNVCCLGLATGISAGGLEDLLDDRPAITAVELSSTVAELARRHFADEVQGFFERPANRVAIEDARTFIASVTDQYDLIVGDLFRPQGAGEGRLYSIEHFRNVRRALTSDGLFCQWLPMYQLNWKNFQVIASTFQRVFPETLVIWGTQDSRTPVLGLVARKDDRKWNREHLLNSFRAASKFQKNEDSLLEAAPGMIVGRLKKSAFGDVGPNTLDNMSVEIDAGNFWILYNLTKNRPKSNLDNRLIRGGIVEEFEKRLEAEIQAIFTDSLRRKFLDRINPSNGNE